MNTNYNNNNYNIIRRIKERVLKNFYPVYHSPLVFDINTQSCYRKAGYVAWPSKTSSPINNKEEEEKHKSMSGSGGYFAYPESKC
jgi:hypothetical protein